MDDKNAVLVTYRTQPNSPGTPNLDPNRYLEKPKIASPRRSPFRATRMWNQLVQSFKDGIELKKKRWKMRVYHNCFSGTEAANLMHAHLKSDKAPDTTRIQAIQLLQKFLQCHIIEDVCRKNSRMFHDDNHLYRFAKQESKSRASPKPIVPSQKSLSKILGPTSVKKMDTQHPKSLPGTPDCCSQKLDTIPEHDNKENAVTLTPLALGLRSVAILSAERRKRVASCCLLEPDNLDDDLQAMENKSFEGSPCKKKVSPKAPFAFDNKCYNSPCLGDYNFVRSHSVRVGRSRFYSDVVGSPAVTCDESQQQNKNSKPNLRVTENYSNDAVVPRKTKTIRNRLRSYTVSLGTPPKKAKQYDDNVVNGKHCDSESTGFPTAGIDNYAADFISRESTLHLGQEDPGPDDMEYIWRKVVLSSLKVLLDLDSLDSFINFSLINGHEIKDNFSMDKSEALQDVPGWLVSAMKCLVDWPSSLDREEHNDLPNYDGFEHDVFMAIKDHYEKTLEEPLMTYHFFKVLQKAADLIPLEKQKCVKVLQLCCLMIPSWNRKQLQVLLRFMTKLAKNSELRLSDDVPNEEVVIHNFQPMIINNKYPSIPDDLTGIRLVLFLIENYKEVFQPPTGLQSQVDYQLAMALGKQEQEIPSKTEEAKSTVLNEKRRSGPPTFCKQLTLDKFEEEAVESTRAALTNLLQSIISDEVMSDKERKKKLKLFKKVYPDIYAAKFPGDNISISSTTNQRSLRIKKVVRPFFFRHSSTSY